MLKELTDGGGEYTFDQPRELTLKGFGGMHTAYSIVGQAVPLGATTR